MKLLCKQLTKEIFKNKIFVTLMLILTLFTSFMYYFVHFSIDGNRIRLNALPSLNDNQILYQNGLISNTILASNILMALTILTGFVFTMFFYRFFKLSKRQLGLLKSLGFKDIMLRCYFITFTAILSLIGSLLGLVAGYFASDLLIRAAMTSYLVTDLVKGLNIRSLLTGFLVPTVVLCVITYLAYYLIQGKEIGLLIAGINNKAASPLILHFTNKIVRFCPRKSKLSMRLALRKPITVFLIILSVMSFSIMFIMGYSLTLSSQKIYESQIVGHHYLFDTHFDTPQNAFSPLNKTLLYLDAKGTIESKSTAVQRTIAGLEEKSSLFELVDAKGNTLAFPTQGNVVIGSELQALHNFQQGDTVTISIHDVSHIMTISDIAFNATSNWVYISKSELSEMLSLLPDAYTGILSMDNGFENGTILTNAQKHDALQRGSVSNRSSALINQAIGCLVGCILLYLALLLNFQDSTRDILILHLMGYQTKSIRKMLIDIYRPILWLSFFLTLWPAIQIVKSILKSISIQIGDYMPFQTNFLVISGIFILLTVIYFLVQATFNLRIQKIIKEEAITNYTN